MNERVGENDNYQETWEDVLEDVPAPRWKDTLLIVSRILRTAPEIASLLPYPIIILGWEMWENSAKFVRNHFPKNR